jgi:hypothetical protein
MGFTIVSNNPTELSEGEALELIDLRSNTKAPDAWSKEFIATRADPGKSEGHVILRAIDGERTVGFIHLAPTSGGRPYISSIVVHQDYRRNSPMGFKLLQRAVERYDAGSALIRKEIGMENAMRLALHFGFEPTQDTNTGKTYRIERMGADRESAARRLSKAAAKRRAIMRELVGSKTPRTTYRSLVKRHVK